MITKSTIKFRMFCELEKSPLIHAVYAIKGQDKIYIVCKENTVTNNMNVRMFLGDLEKKYKIKLETKFVVDGNIKGLFKELETHDRGVMTFGRDLSIEEIYIDKDIEPYIVALNNAGYYTTFSCSGHGVLKNTYILFEYERIKDDIANILKGGIFTLTLDNYKGKIRASLRINTAYVNSNLNITIEEYMKALVNVIVYKDTCLLDVLANTVAKEWDASVSKATELRDSSIEKYLKGELELEK